MKITRFEDLQAWQQARVLANLVYDATEAKKIINALIAYLRRSKQGKKPA